MIYLSYLNKYHPESDLPHSYPILHHYQPQNKLANFNQQSINIEYLRKDHHQHFLLDMEN